MTVAELKKAKPRGGLACTRLICEILMETKTQRPKAGRAPAETRPAENSNRMNSHTQGVEKLRIERPKRPKQKPKNKSGEKPGRGSEAKRSKRAAVGRAVIGKKDI